ncbi:MAG TPA: YXWGXW repeat-containing protein [Casimicrobiaceae bacterium]|nr:YXWGXW repeat-containing protein [Casimicrobiaceae bacterium]
MNVRKALIGTLLVLSAGSMAGFVQARSYIDIQVGPPPDRVEQVPPPRPGYVWAPGYWRWDHGHHVWAEGHWMHDRPGHHWQRDRWVHNGDHWRFEAGHWD